MIEDPIINVDDFKSRNRFQAFVLLMFGLIQFSVVVPSAKDKTDLELWSASAFFTMLGAFMALLLITVEKYDKFSSAVTVSILFIGAIMYISTGCYWCDKAADGYKSQTCSKVFGESTLLAAFACIYLAMDLFDDTFSPFNNRRLRVLANSFSVFLSSILMCGYLGNLDRNMNNSDEAAFAGFVFLMIASFFSFVVIGILNQDGVALFNAVCTLLSYVGIFLVLAYPDTQSSVTIVWWFLFASVIYLMCQDIQAGGTVKVRRSKAEIAYMASNSPSAEREELKEDDENNGLL